MTFVSGFSRGSAVGKLIAGDHISLSPSDGLGTVTINSTTVYSPTTIFVRQLSDFPTPIGGVINLVSGAEYIVTGIVNIGSNTIKINNRNSILGFTRGIDGIVSTTSGTLFDVTNANFVVTNLLISVPNGTIINVNNNTGSFGASINTCILNGNILGTIGGTSTQNFAFRSNTITSTFAGGGFIFTGAGNGLCAIQDNIINNSGGIFLNYGTSVWQQISVSNNSFIANLGQTIITGATNSGNVGVSGLLTGNIFAGSGTYITNINDSDLRWWFTSNSPSIRYSETLAEIYMIGNTIPTTFTAPNTFTKVQGITSVDEVQRFIMSGDNQIQYIGLNEVNLFASAAFSLEKTGGPALDLLGVIYINGNTPHMSSTAEVNIKNNNDLVTMVVQGYMRLQPNDFIEVWINNVADTTSVIVGTMNFSIG